MKKTTTFTLRLNTIIERQAKINTDTMTPTQLRAALIEGYNEMQSGKVQNAAQAFAQFREAH